MLAVMDFLKSYFSIINFLILDCKQEVQKLLKRAEESQTEKCFWKEHLEPKNTQDDNSSLPTSSSPNASPPSSSTTPKPKYIIVQYLTGEISEIIRVS